MNALFQDVGVVSVDTTTWCSTRTHTTVATTTIGRRLLLLLPLLLTPLLVLGHKKSGHPVHVLIAWESLLDVDVRWLIQGRCHHLCQTGQVILLLHGLPMTNCPLLPVQNTNRRFTATLSHWHCSIPHGHRPPPLPLPNAAYHLRTCKLPSIFWAGRRLRRDHSKVKRSMSLWMNTKRCKAWVVSKRSVQLLIVLVWLLKSLHFANACCQSKNPSNVHSDRLLFNNHHVKAKKQWKK